MSESLSWFHQRSLVSKRGRLCEALLAPTLAFAHANVPYYQHAFRDNWRDVTRLSDLHLAVPILTKQQAIQSQTALHSGVAPIWSPILSSGTRRDGTEVLEVLRSQAELDELDALRDAEDALLEARAEGDVGPSRLQLTLVNTHHGFPIDGSVGQALRVLWMPHDNCMVQILRHLERSFHDGQRVEAMLSSVTALQALTLWMEEREIEPASFAVRHIGTNSSYLSAPRRQWLEERWNARLWDNYSLSEFLSPATECERCGFHHFEHPPIGLELLDPISQMPTERPFGVLAITGLYPYMQAMPLLRYWTDDIVAIDHVQECRDVGLRWMGRRDQCICEVEDDGHSALLFAPAPLLDCLDALPLVARRPHMFSLAGLIQHADLGDPIWNLDAKWDDGHCRGIYLSIGLRCRPSLYRDACQQMKETLRTSLLDAFPGLATRESAGLCKLEIAFEVMG